MDEKTLEKPLRAVDHLVAGPGETPSRSLWNDEKDNHHSRSSSFCKRWTLLLIDLLTALQVTPLGQVLFCRKGRGNPYIADPAEEVIGDLLVWSRGTLVSSIDSITSSVHHRRRHGRTSSGRLLVWLCQDYCYLHTCTSSTKYHM